MARDEETKHRAATIHCHTTSPTFIQSKTMTTRSIVNAVKNDTLFGCVECDIHVPEHLEDNFSEMCPIYKNTEISREDIGEFMRVTPKKTTS